MALGEVLGELKHHADLLANADAKTPPFSVMPSPPVKTSSSPATKKNFGQRFGRTIGGVKIVSVQLLLADLIAQGLTKET